jgi:sialate O-acetylesterase
MRGFALASLFDDHVVLQRGRPNPVWGLDEPGQVVTLTVERDARVVDTVSTKTRPDGTWRLDCPELEPGGPYRLVVRGSAERVISDVLVGEVWLAAGQSNMEWPLAQAENGEHEAACAEWPMLRVFKVARTATSAPQFSVSGAWRVGRPDSAGEFTAIGYFFARELSEKLGVPVGVIDMTWGGTRVEAWASADALRAVMDVDRELEEIAAADSDLERIAADYAAAVTEWEAEALPADPGNRGQDLGWAAPDHDDTAWRTLNLPSYWQAHGMNFNGVVWFRRELDLPDDWAGHDLWLSLGAIDDFDHSYFNGELVGAHPKGTPAACQIARLYRVPGSLVRAGKNVVAVRVFDHVGDGGFVGPAQAMFVESTRPGAGRLPLDGHWRSAVEHEIALVPRDIFRTMPPRPRVLDRENAPAALYNGMVAPLIPFGLRGAIWYQGESNVDQYQSYRQRFTALIRDYRTRWGMGTFPFCFVQLASYRDTPAWPYLREAQADTLAEPATGMAVTIDIGDPHDIHPRNKRDVGHRLALLALANTYGQPVEYSGPVLARSEILGQQVRIRFLHAAGLRTSDGSGAPRGFELGGEDRVFCPADARIEGDTVILQSAEVPAPRAVRYAWADFPDVNLENGAGLPAAPFRTDGF